MGDSIVDAIDAVLAAVFWLPARLIGYKKCSKCTVRVRWFQFVFIATAPIRRVPAVRSRRIDWGIRSHTMDERKALRPASFKETVT